MELKSTYESHSFSALFPTIPFDGGVTSDVTAIRTHGDNMQSSVTWSPETGDTTTKVLGRPEVYPGGLNLSWKKKMEEDSDPRAEEARKQERKREVRRLQRQKAVNFCKKIAAFLFSHIGLAGMVVAYSIAGGFLFMHLEKPAETLEKTRIVGFKENRIEEIWALSNEVTTMSKENFTGQVRAILNRLQTQIVLAVKEKGWDGVDGVGKEQWSFAGALLYAVTVITTIGE